MSKVQETVADADMAVTEAAGDARFHPAVRIAGTISEVADQPPLIALCLLTVGTGLVRRDRRLARAGVRMLASHALATWAKGWIKHRVDRTRPRRALDQEHRWQRGSSHDHELNSFPSGHTAGALAVTQALARDYPATAAAGRIATAAVAAIQVPRAAHFVSDIAAGAAIGWAAERVASAVVDAADRRLTSDN